MEEFEHTDLAFQVDFGIWGICQMNVKELSGRVTDNQTTYWDNFAILAIVNLWADVSDEVIERLHGKQLTDHDRRAIINIIVHHQNMFGYDSVINAYTSHEPTA